MGSFRPFYYFKNIMAKKPFKVVSLFDIHYWEHIDLKPVLQFIKDEQPNEIILGWDQLDLFTISKYYKWDVEEWIYKARQEILEFKKFLKQLKKASPNSWIIWLDWNHEYRIWEYVEEKPDRKHLLDYQEEYKDYIDKFFRYNEYYNVGKLYYTHWIYHNDAHSKKMAMNVERNIRYWHLHSYQVYTKVTPIDTEAHTAKCIPCLSKINPDYMKGKPNARLNWFNIAYFDKDWYFNDYDIIITNWRFIFNWKTYA